MTQNTQETEVGQETFLKKLKALRNQMKAGGGEKRIEAQHGKGKMTARERIDILLDENTFQELNGLMFSRHTDFGLDKEKIPGDGIVAGFGKINGRRVCVYAQDFTIMGGSFGEVAGQKSCPNYGSGNGCWSSGDRPKRWGWCPNSRRYFQSICLW
jgi:acetyl-CoA carboxylase carboxyltransferase component